MFKSLVDLKLSCYVCGQIVVVESLKHQSNKIIYDVSCKKILKLAGHL